MDLFEGVYQEVVSTSAPIELIPFYEGSDLGIGETCLDCLLALLPSRNDRLDLASDLLVLHEYLPVNR